jgi:hypothetical protein
MLFINFLNIIALADSLDLTLQSWHDENQIGLNKANLCGSFKTISSGDYMQKTIKTTLDLKKYPHHKVIIEGILLFLDYDWIGQAVEIFIDNQLVQTYTSNFSTHNYHELCGINNQQDRYFFFSFVYEHIRDEMDLEFRVKDDSKLKWALINNLNVTTSTFCQVNSIKIGHQSCRAKEGYYFEIISPCEREGYNRSFCKSYRICPILCESCSDYSGFCDACVNNLSLEENRCIPHTSGKLKFFIV